MAKSLAKILVGFLWVLAFVFIIVLPRTTYAFFSDQETGSSNLFHAGTLDFYLQSPSDFTPEISPTQTSSRDIQIVNTANLFRYIVQAENISGDLCGYINIFAYLNGDLVCSGPLSSFNCTNLTFETGDPNPSQWHFVANLTSQDAPQNSQCQFEFVFYARQINLPSGGFHDEEEISNAIYSGNWQPPSPQLLITKVYYDVDTKHGSEITNEWIELYNPNTDPVDLSGWIIEDNNAQDIIPSSTIIPAQGYLLISASSSTWSYWLNIPPSVAKLVLPDGSIGDGLDNDGDRVILKDDNGYQIDALSYENDTSIFDPAAPLDSSNNTYDLPEGHLLARIPVDLDTDTADDWQDLGLPNVNVISPSGGTWYCNQLVNIRWNATNPNGSNSNLLITIQYIQDLDNSGTITSSDAIDTIAQNIPNTGSYSWQVSPCYYGYVWIRIIAQGEENFMVHNDGLSGMVFEPPQSSQQTTQDGEQSEDSTNNEDQGDEQTQGDEQNQSNGQVQDDEQGQGEQNQDESQGQQDQQNQDQNNQNQGDQAQGGEAHGDQAQGDQDQGNQGNQGDQGDQSNNSSSGADNNDQNSAQNNDNNTQNQSSETSDNSLPAENPSGELNQE